PHTFSRSTTTSVPAGRVTSRPLTRIVSRSLSAPDRTNVAVVWFADTDSVLPRHLSRKLMVFQPDGSHGLKVIRPLRTRKPPNPFTIICQVPPAEAIWMPSSVLP